MAKLSAIGAAPGGAAPGDLVYVVRGDGASPETFTSYQALIDKLLAYDFGFAFGDTPEAGAIIQRVRIGRAITIPANMAGGAGGVATNPDATWDVDVQDDGVSIGTISVSTGGVVTFTTVGGTAKSVAAGSEINFVAPSSSPPEASVAGGSFIILATQD
jgi:hypothetical protein